MSSELVADSKPQCVHTDLTLTFVEKSNSKPMIGFTSVTPEGRMLLVWNKIPIAGDDYVSKPKQLQKK